MVPKRTGGLCPILNLKHFNCFMHITSFKMPTLKTVWQLIQQGDYAFSIDLQDAYLHVPIIKHHRQFLCFVWHVMCLISGGFYFLDLPQPLGFSHPSQNLFCSFAITKVCISSSIWMISWFLFALSRQVKGHTCFCVPCWSILVYISIFPSRTFASLSPLPFWGLCWDTICMSVSLPLDKLAETQQLALALLRTPHVTVHKVMSFLGKANFFYQWPFPIVVLMSCYSEWHAKCLPFSHTIVFLCSFFSFIFTSTGPWLANITTKSCSIATSAS